MKTLWVIFLGLIPYTGYAESVDYVANSEEGSLLLMQQLVGNWEGTVVVQGKEVPLTASYEFTSGGKTVIEKLDIDGNEMFSVYYPEGGEIAMTHYCSLGNRPYLKMSSLNVNEGAFEMVEPIGIQSEVEPHMRAVTWKLTGDDTLEHEWILFSNGVQADVMPSNLRRVEQ